MRFLIDRIGSTLGVFLKKVLPRKLARQLQFLKTMGIKKYLVWARLSESEKYAYFQKIDFEKRAGKSYYEKGSVIKNGKNDFVVGSYEEHNNWSDYDNYLMKYVSSKDEVCVALDFGCGPGRNVVKYAGRFARIDGIDISENNILNALKNVESHGIENSNFYVNNGFDLEVLQDSKYDFVFSTICMQHICVHETRYSLLKEMFRVLRKGGRLSIQMGYGLSSDDPSKVGYFENVYDAVQTNGGTDVYIESPEQVKYDLDKIGYSEFEYYIRPTGPGDDHESWIYFTAIK